VISSRDFCYIMDDVVAAVPSETGEEVKNRPICVLLKIPGAMWQMLLEV